MQTLHRMALAAALALAPGIAARQTVALKDLVPKGWLIGAAINQNQSGGRDTVAVDLVTKQFNTISPENLLKFQSVHGQPDQFTFDAQDRYVAFGLERGMAVIGHNLVWHSETPAWVWAGAGGGLADRATMLERMHAHIATVVGRYKGKIRGWDVVNEALNEDGTLRDSSWRRGIGNDYIAKAFEFAHDADPNLELYYNDNNLATKPAKRAGAIRIIKDLQQRGLRSDAVGEQGHWQLESPAPAEIDQAITELRATDVKVMITELDINLLPSAGPPAPGQPPAPLSNPYANGAARRHPAGPGAAIRRRLSRPAQAPRRHHPRDVLGCERRGFVAEPRADELPATVGSPAAAETGVRRSREGADGEVVRRRLTSD